MRLPYIDQNPTMDNAEDQAVLERVLERRGGKLIELDRALLHAPPVADGWNSFLKAIRTQTSLSTAVREIAICRVAILNHAWYEWDHHCPILRETSDITEEGVQYVLKAPHHAKDADSALDAKHQAVLAYSDAMTLDVKVPDAVFGKLKSHFSDREVVEITATVAAYNTVSRFLVALDVGETNSRSGPAAK
ncbi:4-carboxymuconolactone decarboxylase-like protein [Cryomyces antarcticus]